MRPAVGLLRLHSNDPRKNPLAGRRAAMAGHSDAGMAPVVGAGLVLHGLRGHACVRLRLASANAQQIADMVGMSVPMVERYCRLSVQRENASAAVLHMERTLSERRLGIPNRGPR